MNEKIIAMINALSSDMPSHIFEQAKIELIDAIYEQQQVQEKD